MDIDTYGARTWGTVCCCNAMKIVAMAYSNAADMEKYGRRKLL